MENVIQQMMAMGIRYMNIDRMDLSLQMPAYPSYSGMGTPVEYKECQRVEQKHEQKRVQDAYPAQILAGLQRVIS